jgi:hypothetical protein
MSALCLTCESNNLTENCVFTVQGDLECYNKGVTPEQNMLASLKQNKVNTPATNENIEYPVNGVDSSGYYRYISDLSGEPIQMRYGQTIPADVTNACASKITDRKNDSGNANGLPEWGPHSTWISDKEKVKL